MHWFNVTIIKRYKALIIFLLLFFLFLFSLPPTLFRDPTCTLLDDANGELLGARIAADGQWRFPAAETVPDKFTRALICFEDRRFYQHQGVDGIAIGRALLQNFKQKKVTEGGSTLTMQIVRLMRKGKRRTIKEKIIEAYYALRLEASYNKQQLLTLYASHAPFGSNVVGINAAAWRYFGREADDLSWAEAATLAVLPNAPALIHPGRNRDALLRKRNALLDKLHSQGAMDEETCELAKTEILPEKPLPLPMHAPHLLDKVTASHPGQRVQSTILQTLQERVNNVAQRYIQDFKSNKINNIAILVLDVETGKAVAYVGNAYDPKDNLHGSNVDVITSRRSTGSILKPFLYAAMLDEGEILPNTLVYDIPLYIAGFSPSNYNKTFDGAVTAHRALERSLNVPSVRMLHDYNIEKFHSLLKQMGMTTLNQPAMHYGLSLILGGAEGTLWDMTGIYANMARSVNKFREYNSMYNLYNWHRPYYLASEAKQFEKERLTNAPLIGAGAVWQTLEALSDVSRPEEEASWKVFSSSRRVAWKTGTSYGNRDAWALGVTPGYAVGVWVGNADGEGRSLLTGVGYAAPVLFDVFNLLPNASGWFEQPYDDMVLESVCRKSGYLASDLCEETDSVWVTLKGQESAACPYHMLVHLNEEGTYRVSSDCYPINRMQHESWFVLPPAPEWYYKAKNADYKTLPPIHPDCLHTENRGPMEIIYPSYNLTIVIPRQLNGELGRVVFQAAHRKADAVLFWHIDDEYIGTTDGGTHSLACQPPAGNHVLTLVDNEGNTVITTFTIRDESKK